MSGGLGARQSMLNSGLVRSEEFYFRLWNVSNLKSPVTNFREACCRDYEMGECTRGGFCNFMHLKPISKHLRKKLYNRRSKEKQGYNPDRRRGGRSRSRFDFCVFWLNFQLRLDLLVVEVAVTDVTVVDAAERNKLILTGRWITRTKLKYSLSCHYFWTGNFEGASESVYNF